MKKFLTIFIILSFMTLPYLTFASIYNLENIVSKNKISYSTVSATSDSPDEDRDTDTEPDIDPIEPEPDP